MDFGLFPTCEKLQGASWLEPEPRSVNQSSGVGRLIS